MSRVRFSPFSRNSTENSTAKPIPSHGSHVRDTPAAEEPGESHSRALRMLKTSFPAAFEGVTAGLQHPAPNGRAKQHSE